MTKKITCIACNDWPDWLKWDNDFNICSDKRCHDYIKKCVEFCQWKEKELEKTLFESLKKND